MATKRDLPNPDDEPKTFAEALELLRQDAAAKGLDKLTMEEIDEIIAAARRERRERESQQ